MAVLDDFPSIFASAVDRATAAGKQAMLETLAKSANGRLNKLPATPPGRAALAAAKARLGGRRTADGVSTLGGLRPLARTNPLVRPVGGQANVGDGAEQALPSVSWNEDELRVAADAFARAFREQMLNI